MNASAVESSYIFRQSVVMYVTTVAEHPLER